ncbi:MAG: guanine permease [Verrucomicrobia bacterium GWC2_42_7]|nr:MAG: guanine permease [Verrucomicrobia bacterium GWC2_42_7]
MIEKIFKLKEKETSIQREIVAGLTTFAAMAYILVVNPDILSQAGIDKGSLITVTALTAVIGSLIMGLMTNFPIVMAPGMGTNSYFAFFICIGMGIPWQHALGMVFWNGVLFVLLSITGLRNKIVEAIPDALKIGIQCGIGFFIAFIGLKKAGIIVSAPVILVGGGDILLPSCLLVLGGLFLMTALTIRRFPGAIILTILLISFIGMFVSQNGKIITQLPQQLMSWPHGIDKTFLQLDLLYPIKHFHESYPIILTLLILGMFDAVGALMGLTRRAGLMSKDGKMPKLSQALVADASTTVVGSLLGTSPAVACIESATGIEAGGRTGLTSVVVAICCAVSLFFFPIISEIPSQATAPALILVGIFMAQGLKQLDFDDILSFSPAFCTMILIPLTSSITKGFGLGMIFYAVLAILSGRIKKLSVPTLIITLLLASQFFIEKLR